MFIKDLLSVRQNSTKCAVVDRNRSISYAILFSEAQNISNVLLKKLLARSHVAILLPDSVDYVISYLSILFADCIVIPIYAKSTKKEIENTINYCDVAAIITDTGMFPFFDELSLVHQIMVLDIKRKTTEAYGRIGVQAQPLDSGETAVMLSTSGSTNTPKRVMLSDYNLLQNAIAIIRSLGYTEDERILTVLPLTMASGNTSQLIVSLFLGSTLYIYQEPLHPKFLFREINKNRITTTTIVPSILRLLLSEDKDHINECTSLKTVCFGGGPTDSATLERLKHHALSDRFVQMYGQTEASTRISHLHFRTEKDKLPSVGKPLFNISAQIDVTESDGKAGEILVQGPNVMIGYYKEHASPIKEHWLHTGDVGYIDEDGYLYITGRIKNVIICSGINIHAEEVEDVICTHPSVLEAIVYGATSEQHGEVPIAEVVLKPGFTVNEGELRDYCAQKLATFKIPVQFREVTELTRTYNGKIARKQKEI